jgi:hypothetical protein
MSAGIEITIFRKKNGVLSKRISLGKDGKIESDGSECRMAEGTGRRIKLDGVGSLAEFIDQMSSQEALALGRLRTDLPEQVRVVTKGALHDKTPGDVIARTTDYLHFAAGAPAYMLLDFDRKGQPAEVTAKLKEAGSFWSAVIQVVPGLANAARVERHSTSAGLYRRDTQEWLRGSAGEHVYVAVKDGTDIERALTTLRDRLWLAGYGYFVVGAIGQLLDRSIIDAAVFGPERLVFEGAPILIPPVAQDRKKRLPQAHDGDIIDTTVAIPSLSEAEQTRVAQLKAAARERLKPEAAAARRAWAKNFAASHGLSEDEAERIAADATNYLLQPEFELVFDELGACTVRDVLADPDKYIGHTLADPLEGPAYGQDKAKVFRDSQSASAAQGPTSFAQPDAFVH